MRPGEWCCSCCGPPPGATPHAVPCARQQAHAGAGACDWSMMRAPTAQLGPSRLGVHVTLLQAGGHGARAAPHPQQHAQRRAAPWRLANKEPLPQVLLPHASSRTLRASRCTAMLLAGSFFVCCRRRTMHTGCHAQLEAAHCHLCSRCPLFPCIPLLLGVLCKTMRDHSSS